MVLNKQSQKSLIMIPLLLLAAVACNDGGSGGSTPNADGSYPAPFDINKYPINKLVCDPFGGQSSGDYSGGLFAELFYKGSNPNAFVGVNDYMTKGTKSDQYLFFNNLNVPTRVFSLGFPSETGAMLKDNVGNDLIEYFGMRFHAVLRLADNQPEGLYQIALLSDDGAILRFKDTPNDPAWTELVNNDGDHPTKMGCSVATIEMLHSNTRLIELDYYQGPRYHISIVPMMRLITQSSPAESECGRSGNSRYFDYNNNSAPTSVYNGLLSRGWVPLSAANYQIPYDSQFNPCKAGIAPVISNFAMRDKLDGVVEATWVTDLPSASQLRYVNMDTGVETLTISDNMMRTSHRITISGLPSGSYMLFQGVSISDSYGKAMSTPITMFLR